METESKIHHARADSAFKALDKDGKTGEEQRYSLPLCRPGTDAILPYADTWQCFLSKAVVFL